MHASGGAGTKHERGGAMHAALPAHATLLLVRLRRRDETHAPPLNACLGMLQAQRRVDNAARAHAVMGDAVAEVPVPHLRRVLVLGAAGVATQLGVDGAEADQQVAVVALQGDEMGWDEMKWVEMG